MFDVSHMGKVRVHGSGAAGFLNAVLTNDLGRIADGQAQYSMLCDASGGVIDDLIVYRWSDDELFIIPNAGNATTVVETLRSVAPEGVSVDDHHLDHGIIAVQGPLSAQVVAAVGLPSDHAYMSMVASEFDGLPVVVARSGYTGERGYELVVPAQVLVPLWDRLLEALTAVGGLPAGLGARDTLRLEMGYPLHGHELSLDITPVQARLGWAVGWEKPLFHGREALVAERAAGPRRVLRALRATGRGIPRADLPVVRLSSEAGQAGQPSCDRADARAGEPAREPAREQVGITTSGTFSPTLREGIALALVDPSVQEGDSVAVDVRGRLLECVVVRPPFVAASTR